MSYQEARWERDPSWGVLPKEEWEILVDSSGRIGAGIFVDESNPKRRLRKWVKYDRSELPNDLISIEDLKRFGIDLFDIRQDRPTRRGR